MSTVLQHFNPLLRTPNPSGEPFMNIHSVLTPLVTHRLEAANAAPRQRAVQTPPPPRPKPTRPKRAPQAASSAPGAITTSLSSFSMLEFIARNLRIQPIYVEVTGCVHAAMWLTHAENVIREWRAEKGDLDPARNVAFTLSTADCQDGTGMSVAMQTKARRELRRLGLLKQHKTDGVWTFEVNWTRLDVLVTQQLQKNYEQWRARAESGEQASDVAGDAASRL
jgi:hypothetical protein